MILVVIALLNEQNYPAWWIPILKAVFTVSFVLFAPFVGHASDSWHKRTVMQFATLLKVIACFLLLFSVHPFCCLLIAGLGAAFYSPAKYGLATEMVEVEHLVKANAWLEVSTVLASILGFILGGFLVSDIFRQSHWAHELSSNLHGSGNLHLSILVLIAALSFASLICKFLPVNENHIRRAIYPLAQQVNEFFRSLTLLWGDEAGRISLCITTLFWGVGATMQLLVLVWAQETLGFSLSESSYFQVAGAVGMVLGASIAAAFIGVKNAMKLTKLGYIIGLMMIVLSFVQNAWNASFLMVGVGALCALLIVPFNALLQYRGKVILFSGQSIAVQNFCENTSVLLISIAYSSLLALGVSLNNLLIFFGLLIVLSIFLIIIFNNKK